MTLFVEQVLTTNDVADLSAPFIKDDLAEFAKRVRKKIHGAFFVYCGNNSNPSASWLYLCLEGYPATLGRLFVSRSYDSKRYGARIYGIESYKRINNRADGTRKESTDINTAVRNAAKFLTVRSMHTLTSTITPAMRRARKDAMWAVENDREEAYHKVFGRGIHPDLEKLAFKAYRDDSMLLSGALRDEVQDYLRKNEAYEEALSATPAKFYCLMSAVDGAGKLSRFYLITLQAKAKGTVNPLWEPDPNEHALRYSPNELPEKLLNHIPLLEMVEPNEYIAGTGVKICKGVYFIEKHDERD